MVTTKNPRISTYEALLRWNHPTRGMISPSVFIPIAEELGLITNIGEWVLNDACRVCATWPKDVSVSVNLSAAQFSVDDIVSTVRRALACNGLQPNRLALEITETLMLADVDSVIKRLNTFKEMGVKISLDDFGTGYSSLSYVNSLPLDTVKIDRSFIKNIAEDAKAMALVKSIATLGEDLGLHVVAEGVEDAGQLNTLLENCGISEVQGYYFSKPMPEHEVRALYQHKPDQMSQMLSRMQKREASAIDNDRVVAA